MGIERLQKVLAAAGVASRRHGEELILQGRVTVNGTVVTQLGAKADPDRDAISVDGRPLPKKQRTYYLLLNKPPGYITTASDEHGRATVFELIDTTKRLFPVGRLDKDSEGLLLLTNDGHLANRLMHPRYGLEREYLVWTQGVINDETLERLRSGTWVEGKRAEPVAVSLEDDPQGGSVLRFVLNEGRKREVRTLCALAGLRVSRLLRVRYGPLRLGNLATGRSRQLTEAELRELRRAVQLS